MSTSQQPDSRGSDDILEASGAGVDEDTLVQDGVSLDRSRLQSARDRQPPTTIPGYTILRCLGQGAYGSVWLAYEHKTGKQVAIKFYLHRRGLDWTLLNREIEKLAVLYTSRHIVRLIDVGWGSDPPYFIMEYLENGSLQMRLERNPLDSQEAVRIVKAILHGLVHAHGSGILHCDLKPANVLLDAELEPRLCDFGQSRLSDQQDPALGTLFYMAPEQASLGAIPDARWDVYALGALFYHLLCGHPPYRTEDNEHRIQTAESLEERLTTYRRIVRESPQPSEHRRRKGVDKRLEEIVDRCLSVDPEKRFPNAQAVLDALAMRDRQRARQPLIALGVIGPALLLASLLPIALYAMRNAVNTARNNQIDRALESDALSVKLLARGIERDLEQRKSQLVEIASEEPLRKAMEAAVAAGWSDRSEVDTKLDRWYQVTAERRQRYGHRPESSWFLCDADGIQRWRNPASPRTLDRDWSHRDYFHGHNRNYDSSEHPNDIAPIVEPHISVAYRGTSQEKYKVAISVPIWDTDGNTVIGVLARTSVLGDLLSEYEDKIHNAVASEIKRIIALVDYRDGTLLDHPWIHAAHLRNTSDRIETFEQLKVDRNLVQELSALHVAEEDAGIDYRTDDYADPVGQIDAQHYGSEWLAAFCPVRNTSWMAAVQEPRHVAIQPVEKLQKELNRYFWLGVWLFFALIGAMWFFVGKALLDHEGRFWSRNGVRRSRDTLSTVADV